MYKVLLVILCCLTLQTDLLAQSPFGKYFELKAEQFQVSGKTILNIYPAVNPVSGDTVLGFMNRYKRRFEYILLNRTNFSTRNNDLYPDVRAMSRRYTDSLIYNPRFVGYYNQLVLPVALKDNIALQQVMHDGSSFTSEEMMQVASRFFYCDGVRPDNQVSWHVCVGLNGMKEAKWDKDMTLLEAFVFEAIFNTWMTGSDADQQLYNHFNTYVTSAATANAAISPEKRIETIRREVFAKMEKDALLQSVLFKYYQQVKNTLPLAIL
jgi:hypothetical protein